MSAALVSAKGERGDRAELTADHLQRVSVFIQDDEVKICEACPVVANVTHTWLSVPAVINHREQHVSAVSYCKTSLF